MKRGNEIYFAGLDIGSTMTKAVILDEGEEIVNYVLGPTGPEHRRLANMVMEEVLNKPGLLIDNVAYIVATGYGRINVPFADAQVTEITCHARGIIKLFPEVSTIIDIGGQDCKGIRVKDGKVANFVMNDKCAAGTGRFLEIIAETLGIKVSEMGDLSLNAKEKVRISNICTVFAVQEIMAYSAKGIPHENIVAGLHEGLATRICNMARRIGITKEVVITGGGGKNKGLVREIDDHLEIETLQSFEPLISGALGASLLAKEMAHKQLEKGKSLPLKERSLKEVRLFG